MNSNGLKLFLLGVMCHASLRGPGLPATLSSALSAEATDKSTAHATTLPKPTIDVRATWDYFARVRGKRTYSNKADFNALERVFLAFSNLGYNHRDTKVLIGGTNAG